MVHCTPKPLYNTVVGIKAHFRVMQIMLYRGSGVLSMMFYIFLLQAKYLTKKTVAGSVDAIRSLDESLVQLAVSTTKYIKIQIH